MHAHIFKIDHCDSFGMVTYFQMRELWKFWYFHIPSRKITLKVGVNSQTFKGDHSESLVFSENLKRISVTVLVHSHTFKQDHFDRLCTLTYPQGK